MLFSFFCNLIAVRFNCFKLNPFLHQSRDGCSGDTRRGLEGKVPAKCRFSHRETDWLRIRMSINPTVSNLVVSAVIICKLLQLLRNFVDIQNSCVGYLKTE